MNDLTISTGPARSPSDRRSKVLIAFAVFIFVLLVSLVALRVVGLIRVFSVPNISMSPTIAPGDHVAVEGITYLARKPRRGDVAVFKTDGLSELSPGDFYVKRIAGEPGDRVRLSDGKLFINDKHLPLTNAGGEIAYPLPRGAGGMARQSTLTVPAGHYYVLGDDSLHSADSRFWGSVPAQNFVGRVVLCYWPPARAGAVR